MRWHKREIDQAEVKAIASRYGLDLLTATVLSRRGVTAPEEIRFYLERDLRFTHNPFLFDSMEDAVDRLLQAVEEGERIKIFGDRDVDGITSTVLMYSALKELGADVDWALPNGDDPYGLTIAAVNRFIDEGGGTLLVTVDCGISNLREISYAAERGLETVVVDHHNPPEELPPAVAIVNPKLQGCSYPFRDLAGCGVVAKVIWALRFGGSPLYKQTFCLMNVRPGNGTYVVEAVKLRNLVVVERLVENLAPGLVRVERTRLPAFLSGCEILAYDVAAQEKMLGELFGSGVEFGLIDLAPEIARVLPEIAGKSVLKVREHFRETRYRDRAPSEIDVLVDLLVTALLARTPALFDHYLPLLDLVALGTLADLMPLRNENRILVRRGMEVLNATERGGLRELLAAQNLIGKRLSTTDVGWQLSPVINASGRMGVPGKAAELLLTSDSGRRRELAEAVTGLNRERKRLGDAAWERVLPHAKASFEELSGKLILVADREINRGITGIIAARLVNAFNAPAIVVAILGDKAVASLRSVPGFKVGEFLSRSADLFIDYGGHDFAAGFSITLERFQEFTQRLPSLVEGIEPAGPAEEGIEIDAELPSSYMTPQLVDLVERFEPYGEANPPLVFLSKGMTIAGLDLVGKREQSHVKLLLDSGAYKWPAVYWNAANRVGRDFSAGDRVDVVFRLGRNYFQNRESLQLTILDLKR